MHKQGNKTDYYLVVIQKTGIFSFSNNGGIKKRQAM